VTTVFFRLLDAPIEERRASLLSAIQTERGAARDTNFFPGTVHRCEPAQFGKIPGSPFAYWASKEVWRIFSQCAPFGSQDRTALVGLQTSDDFRFVRMWWEIETLRMGKRWFGFAKGGAFSPFYADLPLVVGYSDADQAGLQAIGRYGRGATHYFHAGLTWPLRTDGLSFRAMPAACIFGHKGPSAFVKDDHEPELLALLAIVNSAPFGHLVATQLARTELAQSYEVGLVQQTPLPDLIEPDRNALSMLARRAWSLKRQLDTTNETSHAFVLPPGSISYEAVAPHESAGEFVRLAITREIDEIQREVDERVFALYGIGEGDRVTIEISARRGSGSVNISEGDESEEDDGDADEEADSDAGIGVPVLPVFSWLVGVAFGRFDHRLATGERPIPPEPEPFDPLPARSPGMWPEGEVRAVQPPDVMVDDPGHVADIHAHVTSAAARAGLPEPEDLRPWLAREFFALHIKMYSKSRRKAPIYWQLATASASYSVWLYIHAFTNDTLFRVQNDYVAPKVAHEERRLESMRHELREKATAAERKALATQEAFVEELRAFLDEVKRVAPLWRPNLDDGVIINFAPLWRLVPQHKAWQKELKATWDALCEGKYDWAHLAMHLWPERVVPTCATDRSFAIAHGLEDVFWIEGEGGKWAARKTPTRDLDELVRERTSPALKSALKSLRDAPGPVGAAKKPRKGKAHA
jgi:hypothetical protein